MTEPHAAPSLRRVLRTRDLVWFYIVAVVGMRWVAVAAAAGPSSLVVWVIGAVGLFLPLAFTVLELSTRYPQEGGIYVWTKRAFGDFAGFVTGWTYWGSNLTYLPGLLYFAASTALYIFGSRFDHLQTSPAYFITFSLAGLLLAAALNIRGLQLGTWLTNIGAYGVWIPLTLLIVMGFVAAARFGSATPITARGLLPSVGLKDMIFWATLAFGFGGFELGSFMGEEIENPRRTVPRAVLLAGLAIPALYMLGTLAILLALPVGQITGLQGIMDAIVRTGARVGLPGLGPLAALLIVLSAMGGVGAWLSAPARLPFVAGIDHYLPRAFGKLHPRYGTPYVALLLQAVVAAVCAILGQAGETPKKAYDILVSLGIIAYFVPYLAMFAAMIRLQREPAGPEVMLVPGGKPAAVLCGAVGFLTSAVAIVLAAIPAADEPHPQRYVVKVVGLSALLVASGAATYAVGRRRAAG
ncbi:MAG: APC family permease [Gemmatimonadota bacterium]|nr:APC family permease [Gemmatimonadota bacterium]HEU4990801.1 APC family permease [Gemmatimonadaceae bacterium]